MRVANYRLGQYRIRESGSGELSWEAHFGLSEHQEGRCFKKGTILFIGPPENQSLGFLIGEFFDQLKQYPAWLKTEYYCRGLDVYQCTTGKQVTEKEMFLWMFDREGGRPPKQADPNANHVSERRNNADVAFRLQRYEIIENTAGKISWKTFAGPNSGSGGVGFVLEDILFIGPYRHQISTLNKQEFLSHLSRLPKWNETTYYCLNLSLHECRPEGNEDVDVKKWWHKGPTAETGHTSKEPEDRRAKKTNILYRLTNVAGILFQGAVKCIITAAKLAQPLASLIFAFMFRHWKKVKGRL